MQAEIVHMSRRNAMGTMASTLAHELNQPLTAASNYMSAARRLARKADANVPRPLVDALELATASTLRAGAIVRRLRELVADGTTSARAENLPQLIEEASFLALSESTIERLNHRFEVDPGAQWVWADRIQVQQVMINLIRNATEAMSQSTQRELVIATKKLANNMAEVRVSDTGCGIDPTKADSLVSQFVTTKSGGMGVGLPISRTIIEAHGGRLWADPPRLGGATFCFTLPLSTRLSKTPPEL